MLAMTAGAVVQTLDSRRVSAQAPTAATPTPDSGLNAKVTALAESHRLPLIHHDVQCSGAGWDWLLTESTKAMFTAVGEEHGLAAIPQVTSALYKAAGYERLSVEISPPTAGRIDTTLRLGGLPRYEGAFGKPPISVAFYTNREDAALLAMARAASANATQVIWGTDYEVANDRALLRELVTLAPPGAAKDTAREILAASEQSWDKAMATKNPALIWTFCGDPALFDRLRAVWPDPDSKSFEIIECLQRTLRINALWLARDEYGSNLLRANGQRENLLHYIHAEQLAGIKPRVMFRYGEEHVLRGVSQMGSFDLGSLIGELAAINGGASFHIMMMAGHGSTRAVLDPTVLTYRTVPTNGSAYPWLHPFVELASGENASVFNLRALRPTVANAANNAPISLLRTVLGYDALVILPDATPATPFG